MSNFQRAAIKAYETIRDHKIEKLPIFPLQIIEKNQNVFVFSFTEASSFYGMGRAAPLDILINQNVDAITVSKQCNGDMHYIVAYNQRFPYDMLQQALAVELGHIVLGHNGSTPEDVSYAEAVCFARHLLVPRPLVQIIKDAGAVPTVSTIGTITGCYGRYIAGMRNTPGITVPAELNRVVKEQLSDYVSDYLNCTSAFGLEDESPEANFGTYMDGYEE